MRPEGVARAGGSMNACERLLLAAYDLEAVALELGPACAAVAERLELCD
jgi:hypothetical protein